VEMELINKYKIEFERWIMRRRIRRDAIVMAKAITKADELSDKLRKRLWVFKVDASDYRIFTKAEIKGTLRSMRLQRVINIYHTNEYIIHITKKPE
jgi:hypothetical protein